MELLRQLHCVLKSHVYSGADPGGVQGVRTPALLIRVLFLESYMSINVTGNA